MSGRAHALERRIDTALEAARTARLDGDATARLAALEDALAAAVELGESERLATLCWRLAKARSDEGRVDALIDALEPLLSGDLRARGVWGVNQAVGPFDLYPQAVRAWPGIARTVQDHLGYADARLDALWAAWLAAVDERGDPFHHRWGQVQRAWAWTCTGRHADVAALAERLTRTRPDALRGATTAHPRAISPEQSLGWLQLDVHRTLLRGATWAGDAAAARLAHEELEDLAELLSLDRSRDPWWLDAVVRAAHRFGWEDVVRHHGRAHAATARHPDLTTAFQARVDAFVAGTPDAAAQAAVALAEAHAGPEWVVEALRAAGAHTQADALADRTGVVVRRT